jgi:HCOMODA/2-hydroxy-3-carboxy-muconic semialdehyde decarboxylase
MYSERVIHGEIYKARPDVMAVCHHHAPAVMPFCITGEPLVPVFHLGATMGATVPFWDSLDEFGDTNLLVVKPEEGASLARALGPHTVVLLRRHGATVVGASLRELVFRSVYSCLNAVYLSEGKKMGRVGPLTPGEILMAGAINKIPSVPFRTWEYWATRLAKRGGMPPRAATSTAARKGSSSSPKRRPTVAKTVAKRGRGGAKVKGRK